MPAATSSGIKLLVDRLKDSPTAYVFDETEAWRAVAERIVPELTGALAEPIHVELRAHRMGQDIYLEGTLTGALALECSRCVARYRLPLREPFRLVLEPAGSRVPAEPEAARALAQDGVCLGDELDTGWYRGHEIDLGAFLREVVTLAIPVQPLCREDCRGLCPRCGADRNAAPCGCETHSELPDASHPFAALGALRGGGSRGPARGDS
jgi:uncharacterized protein